MKCLFCAKMFVDCARDSLCAELLASPSDEADIAFKRSTAGGFLNLKRPQALSTFVRCTPAHTQLTNASRFFRVFRH